MPSLGRDVIAVWLLDTGCCSTVGPVVGGGFAVTAGGGGTGETDRPPAPEAPPADAPAEAEPAAPPRPAVAACSF